MLTAWVLISAGLHAVWNAMLRREPDKDRGVVAAIAAASVFAGIIAVAQVAMGTTAFPTVAALAWTCAAGLLEAVYFMTLARALEIGPLGLVYTLSRGGAVLVVWPVSVAMLGEPMTVGSLTGSAIVLAGLVVTTGLRTVGGASSAVGLALVCAVFVAGYHLAYKWALAAGGSPASVFSLSLGLATVIALVRLRRAGRLRLAEVVRARWRRLALLGVVCSSAFLILMMALVDGGAGFVFTLRNTSVLFATAIGWWMAEPTGPRAWIGSALVAIGAVVLGWPA